MSKKTNRDIQSSTTGLEIRELPKEVREDGYPSLYPHIELPESAFEEMEQRLRQAITGVGGEKLDEHSVPELLMNRLGGDEEAVLCDLVEKRYKEAKRINEANKRAAQAKRVRLQKELDTATRQKGSKWGADASTASLDAQPGKSHTPPRPEVSQERRQSRISKAA